MAVEELRRRIHESFATGPAPAVSAPEVGGDAELRHRVIGSFGAPATVSGPRPRGAFDWDSLGTEPPQTEGEATVREPGGDWTPEEKRLAVEVGAGIIGAAAGDKGVSRLLTWGPKGVNLLYATGIRALSSGTAEAGASVATSSWDPEFSGNYASPEVAARAGRRFLEAAGGEAIFPGIQRGGQLVGSGVSAVASKIPGVRRVADQTIPELVSKVPVVGRLVRPVHERLLEPGAKEALELVESERMAAAGSRTGVRASEMEDASFTAGQLVRSQPIDVMENIAESSFFGGGRVLRKREVTRELLKDVVEQYGQEFGSTATKELAGEIVQDSIEGGVEAFTKGGKKLYTNLDDEISKEVLSQDEEAARLIGVVPGALLPGTSKKLKQEVAEWVVETENAALQAERALSPDELAQMAVTAFRGRKADPQRIQAYAKAVSKKRAALGKGAVSAERARAIAKHVIEEAEAGIVPSPQLLGIAKRIMAADEHVPFARAQQWRSELLSVERLGPDEPSVSKVMGRIKQLAHAIDGDMTQAASRIGAGAAQDARRLAEAYWKQGKERFNSTFIKGLIKKDADAVFDAAVKARHPSSIRQVREIVMDQDPSGQKWRALQGRWVEDVIWKARDDLTGELSGGKLVKLISQFGGSDNAALRELFQDGGKHFKTLADAAAIAEKRAGGNRSGSMFVQLAQASAVVGLVAAPFDPVGAGEEITAGAAVILLGPRALGFVVTNPSTVRWLTVGMKEVPGTRAAARAMGHLISHLGAAVESGVLTDDDVKMTINGEEKPIPHGRLAKPQEAQQ